MSHKRSTVPPQYARLNTGSAEGGGVGGYPSSSMRLAGNQTPQNPDPKSQQSAPQQLGPPGGLAIGYQTRNQGYYRAPTQAQRMPPPRHPPNAQLQLSHGTQNSGQIQFNIGGQHPQHIMYNPVLVRIPQNHSQSNQAYQHHTQIPIGFQQPFVFHQSNYDFQRTAYMSAGVAPSSNASHVPAQTPPQHAPIVSAGGNGLANMQGLSMAPAGGGNMLGSIPTMQHMAAVGPAIGGSLAGQPHMQGHQMSVAVPSGPPPPGSNQRKAKTRARALKIVDPDSGDDVIERMMNQETSSQSNDSSTSLTLQPQMSSESEMATRIQSEFALKVAATVQNDKRDNGNNTPSSLNNRVTETSGPPPPSVQPNAQFHPNQQQHQQLPHSKDQRESPPPPAHVPPSSTVLAPPSPPTSPLVTPPVTTSVPTSQPPLPSALPFQPQVSLPVEEKVNGPTIPTSNEIQETEVPKPKVEPPPTAQPPQPSKEIPRVSAKMLFSSATSGAVKQPHSSQISHSSSQQPTSTPPSSSAPSATVPPSQRKPQPPGPVESKSAKQEKKQEIHQPKESRGPFPPSSSTRPGPGSTPPPVAKVVVGPPPGLASIVPPQSAPPPVVTSTPVAPVTTSSNNAFEKLINFNIQSVPPMTQPQQPASSPSPAVAAEETNGETDNHESSAAQVGKASQRQKGKKQKKDLNRKGQEKEGTEMDAFTDSTETPAMASSATTTVQHNKQSTPSVTATTVVTTSNARVATPPPSLSQPSTVSTTAPETSSKVDAIIRTEETLKLAEDSSVPSNINNIIDAGTVPAKNDEYAKQNAAGVESNNNLSNEINDSSNSPTSDSNNNGREENGEVDHETEDSERTSLLASEKSISKTSPKLNYKEGQWSPANLDGKRVYDRNFLLEVKLLELASKKPDILPDLEILKDKPNENIPSSNRRNLQSSSMSGRGDSYNFRGSPSQRGPMMNMKGNRGPQQLNRMSGSMGGPMGGPRGMGGKGPGHPFNSISLNAYPLPREEQLHTDENRWEPNWKGPDTSKSKEDLKTEVLLKKVRGILNKLTPQKFDVLLKQFMDLPIDNDDRLKQTVTLVFSKAVDEPSFSVEYANLCRELQTKGATAAAKPADDATTEAPKSQTFRKVLLLQCQDEFEKNKREELDIEARNKEIEACTDPEKKKELKLLFEEDERRTRRKSVGLVRFIGELYKLRMLTSNIMHNCITTLLDKIDEESLECLCKLLSTVGKMLEESEIKNPDGQVRRGTEIFNEYFGRMKQLARKGAKSNVSSRIRFMLQDVIELRQRQWVPRRDENAPKTLDQIHKDAEREREMSDRQMLSPMPNSMNNMGMRGKQQMDDRRRGGQKNQSDTDWQMSMNKNSRSHSGNVDCNKLSNISRGGDISDMQLGKMENFGKWSAGARAGGNSSSNFGQPINTTNKFALLSSQGSLGGRKIGPSASTEKERMLSSVKEAISGGNDRRGGVSNRMSRPGSGPPSRESSRPRYGEPGSSPAGSIGSDRPFMSSLGTANTTTSAASSLLSSSSSSSTGKSPVVSSNANTPSSGSPTPVTAPSPAMSDEEYDRMSKTILDEWCAKLAKEKETIETMKLRFGNNVAPFIQHSLNAILEKPKNHAPFCKLLVTMVEAEVVSAADAVNEYSQIMEAAYDLIVDIPHLWQYLCNLIAPVIAEDVFTFGHVSQMCQQIKKEDLSKLLVKIVLSLLNEKSTKWIRSKWDSSDVKIEDFLAKGVDANEFLKKNNMEFLVGEITEDESSSTGRGAVGNTSSSGSGSSSLTAQEIEAKLVSILESQGRNAYETASTWIKNNVTEKDGYKDLDFIKTLTRAVLLATASPEQLSPRFENCTKLLRIYIDNDEACELACLQAITRLMIVELSASSNVTKELFSQLLDTGTISRNGFIKWQQVSEEEEGTGVMMKTLTAFFVELSEDACGESSDES